MEELNDTRAKWYDIGLQLRLRVGTLDAISEQYDDPSHCLRESLKTWLKTCPSLLTWKNIVDALRCSTVGEVRLAADLEQKYCSAQNTSVAATHHPSQADTQTSPQQSQSQAHTQMTTLPPQSTVSPAMLASSFYSVMPPSYSPPWSSPCYYSPHTGYPFSTPFPLTLPPFRATTASVHPSYSQVPQVIPTSSRPLLPSVPLLPTVPQFPTAFPQYPSPSFTITLQDTFPIPPPATVTTPPDIPQSVTTGMKVS